MSNGHQTRMHHVYGRYQKVVSGQHKTIDRRARNMKWQRGECAECTADVWLPRGVAKRKDETAKDFKPLCKNCRSKSRKEACEALLAVQRRKKKMGLRW